MRVMLIDNFKPSGSMGSPVPDGLQIGTPYTVTEIIEVDGVDYFTLLEIGNDKGFDCRSFATLPESTASEMYEVEIEGILF